MSDKYTYITCGRQVPFGALGNPLAAARRCQLIELKGAGGRRGGAGHLVWLMEGIEARVGSEKLDCALSRDWLSDMRLSAPPRFTGARTVAGAVETVQ
jgi:hypothetical protein